MSTERFLDTLFAIRHFCNWPEILLSIINGDEPTRVVLSSGLEINSTEWHLGTIRLIFYQNIYTPHPLRVRRNDIVVDIGANIGVFTLFAAFKTHNMVYAFEPFTESCKILNHNVRKNNLTNVRVCCAAVSDKNDAAKLFLSDTSCEGHMVYEHIIKGKLETYVEVPAYTLQNIMDENNIANIGFLKLDCEGSEGAILTSTPRDYLRRVRQIALEFHDKQSAYNHDDIIEFLRENEYITTLRWNGKSAYGYIYAWRC